MRRIHQALGCSLVSMHAASRGLRVTNRQNERGADARVIGMPDPEVLTELRAFVRERDWSQFHSPENLAKSISIESAELLECFQWNSDADPARLVAELADVLTYCYLLADRLEVDADKIVADKLHSTRSKYPVDRARGKSTKYDQL